MSNLSFGRRQRFRFEALGKLPECNPQVMPAVYAITYLQSPDNRPKSHTVLFFGEADDMSKETASMNQQVVDWWVTQGGKANDLFIFVHPMPSSTRWSRSSIQSQLISEYSPHGNF